MEIDFTAPTPAIGALPASMPCAGSLFLSLPQSPQQSHDFSLYPAFRRGLPNTRANLCFHNAAVVALLSIPSIAEQVRCLFQWVESIDPLSGHGSSQPHSRRHAAAIRGLHSALTNLNTDAASRADRAEQQLQAQRTCQQLYSLRDSEAAGRENKAFAAGGPADLHEFMSVLLDAVNIEVQAVRKYQLQKNGNASPPEPQQTPATLRPNFMLWLTSRVWCTNTGPHPKPHRDTNRRVSETELVLQIDFSPEAAAAAGSSTRPQQESFSLDVLLDRHFQKQSLDPTVSSVNDCCDQRGLQFTQQHISTEQDWPELLCIVLSRSENRSELVACPEQLDTRKWNGPSYSLHAACNHSPGHFVVMSRQQEGWKRFNDGAMSEPIPMSKVINKGTYMLIYQRAKVGLLEPNAQAAAATIASEAHPSPNRVIPSASQPAAAGNIHEVGAAHPSLGSLPSAAITSSHTFSLAPRKLQFGSSAAVNTHTLMRRFERTRESLSAIHSAQRVLSNPASTAMTSTSSTTVSPRKLAAQYFELRFRSTGHSDRVLSPNKRQPGNTPAANRFAAAALGDHVQLHKWAEARLRPTLPFLAGLQPQLPVSPPSTPPSTPPNSLLQRFASRVSETQSMSQALLMTDWHSQWQSLFPPSAVEAEFRANRDQRRSDTLCNGWRCEFETIIPSVNKVRQREALCSNIVWVLNFTASAYRKKLTAAAAIPTSHACPLAGSLKTCQHRVNTTVQPAGLKSIRCLLYLDLGFSDCLLRIHTPLPHDARAASDEATASFAIHRLPWTIECVSWMQFLERHGDIKYFQANFPATRPSFLQRRAPLDTAHSWLQTGSVEIGTASITKSLCTEIQGEPAAAEPLASIKSLPKSSLIRSCTKILLAVPAQVVKDFNSCLRAHLVNDNSELFVDALSKAILQAFGPPTVTRPPPVKYKKHQIRINLLKRQAQLLDQALRGTHVQRSWLVNSTQWQRSIVHYHSFFRTNKAPQSGGHLFSNSQGSRDRVWKQHARSLFFRIAAELDNLTEHRKMEDRAKQSKRLNTLFRSRLGYVIQCIFDPRDAGPALPSIAKQVLYFQQRFRCEYFEAAVPLHAGALERSSSEISESAVTVISDPKADNDLSARTAAATQRMGSGNQTAGCVLYWTMEHTRKRSFTHSASPLLPGTLDGLARQAVKKQIGMVSASMSADVVGGRTRYSRAAKDATLGSYNENTQDQALHDLVPRSRPLRSRSTPNYNLRRNPAFTPPSNAEVAPQQYLSEEEYEVDWSSDEDQPRLSLAPTKLPSASVADVPARVWPLSEPDPYKLQWGPLSPELHQAGLEIMDGVCDLDSSKWCPLRFDMLARAWKKAAIHDHESMPTQPRPRRAGRHARPYASPAMQSPHICVLGNNFPFARDMWFRDSVRIPPGMALVVTDGSCKEQTGGYAGIIVTHPSDAAITPCEQTCATCEPSDDGPEVVNPQRNFHVTVVCGGAFQTTSGTMELMAAYRTLHHVHSHMRRIRQVLLLTDYLSLVQCKWGLEQLLDWKKHQNSFLWERISALLTHFDGVEVKHVKAHDTANRSKWKWKTHMNEQADSLANLAREFVEKKSIAPCKIPNQVLRSGPTWTHDHARAKFLAPICADEMQAALRSININSAPGPDGVPLRIFRHLDTSNLAVLQSLFEEVRRSGVVPKEWKQSRITLIYKKGLAEEVANWRPITVQKCITLFFTKIFARRLLDLLWQLSVIPMTQKCNVQNIAGVNEHCFLLRAVLEDMQTKARLGIPATVVIVFTDVSKAFDSIQRGTLLDVLRELLGDVETFVKLIGSLYEDARIILTDATDQAAEILKEAGIHQGDAMSAILYILVSESARRLYEPNGVHRTGYIFFGDEKASFSCSKLDYEDDDTQLFGSVEEARAILEQLTEAMRTVFLKFNGTKCTTLALRTVPSTGKVEAFDPELRIDGAPLRALSLLEPITTLGLTICGTGDTSNGETGALTKFFKAMTQLDQCTLDVAKKIYLLRTVVNAKIEHHFRNMFFSADTLENLDRLQRSAVRKWLHADSFKANTAFLRAPCDDGGLGLYSLRDRWEILYLTNFAHMICAHDPTVRNAAWSIVHTSQIGLTWPATEQHHGIPRNRLLNETSRKVASEAASPPFFAWAKLPGESAAADGPASSQGSRRNLGASALARIAVQYARLAQKLRVGFEIPSTPDGHSDALADSPVIITLDGTIVEGPFVLLSALTTRQLQRDKDCLSQQKVVDGAIHAHQGISFLPVHATVKFTRLYLSPNFSCYTDAEVSIILKAQLDLWPTAHKLKQLHTGPKTTAPSTLCRLCRQAPETIGHLLSIPQDNSPLRQTLGQISRPGSGCHPEPLASLATHRHNRITSAIVSHLESLGIYTFIASEKKTIFADEHHSSSTAGSTSLAQQLLHPPSLLVPTHTRPDIIVVYPGANSSSKQHCIIIDVACTADEHALAEQDIGLDILRRMKKRFDISGVNLKPQEAFETPTGRKLCRYSPTVSKISKYNAYVKYALTLGYASCEVFPLVFGVRGFIPSSTLHFSTKLLGPIQTAKAASTKQLLQHIMHILLRAIIVIFKAWTACVPPQ